MKLAGFEPKSRQHYRVFLILTSGMKPLPQPVLVGTTWGYDEEDACKWMARRRKTDSHTQALLASRMKAERITAYPPPVLNRKTRHLISIPKFTVKKPEPDWKAFDWSIKDYRLARLHKVSLERVASARRKYAPKALKDSSELPNRFTPRSRNKEKPTERVLRMVQSVKDGSVEEWESILSLMRGTSIMETRFMLMNNAIARIGNCPSVLAPKLNKLIMVQR